MLALNQAIRDLYLAFADVPCPTQINGCPHCLSEKEVEKLISTPLQEIAADDISPYASSAFLTVGEVSDYLYFLPRILEISILDEALWPCIEVTGKAIYASKVSLQGCRHKALTNALKHFVRYLVETESFWRIDEWMCAIALMDFDVKPYLAIVEREPRAVFAFWEENSACLNDLRLGNAFWDPPNHAHDEIVSWFRSDAICKIYAERNGD